MSIKKSLIILGTTILIGTTSAVALAGPGGFGWPMHGRIARLLEDLKLTDQQEDEVFALRRKAKEHRKEMKKQMMGSFDALAEELKKRDPDKKKLHMLIDQNAEAMRASAHARLDDLLKLHGTLSDEQRAVLSDRLAKMERRAKLLADD